VLIEKGFLIASLGLTDPSHERRVREFLAGVPSRRRERAERHYQVLEGNALRKVLRNESCWAPQLLETLPVSDGPVHRTPLKALPALSD